MKISFRIL